MQKNFTTILLAAFLTASFQVHAQQAKIKNYFDRDSVLAFPVPSDDREDIDLLQNADDKIQSLHLRLAFEKQSTSPYFQLRKYMQESQIKRIHAICTDKSIKQTALSAETKKQLKSFCADIATVMMMRDMNKKAAEQGDLYATAMAGMLCFNQQDYPCAIRNVLFVEKSLGTADAPYKEDLQRLKHLSELSISQADYRKIYDEIYPPPPCAQ